MKNFCKALSALFLFFIFVSCSQLNSSQTAAIRISLPGVNSRDVTSDQVMNYVLTITSQSASAKSVEQAAKSGETISVEVDVGTYSVTLKAYEQDDVDYEKPLYEGSVDSVNVTANAVTNVSLKLKKVKYEDPEPTVWKVTFTDDDGTELKVVDVKDGETVEAIETKKDNYTFKAWLLGDEEYDFSKLVTSDITLKASWTKDPVYLTVTYLDKDGKEYKTEKVLESSTAEEIEYSVEGFEFVCWKIVKGEDQFEDYDFATLVTKDITLQAFVKEIVIEPETKTTVTISFPAITKVNEFNITGEEDSENSDSSTKVILLSIPETMTNITWYVDNKIIADVNTNQMKLELTNAIGFTTVKCVATNADGQICVGSIYICIEGEN